MSDLTRESEARHILLPSSSASFDRSSFLRGLGAMGGLTTLAACSGGTAGLPILDASSGSSRPNLPFAVRRSATSSGTTLSFSGLSNGGSITATVENNVMTVTGFNSAGASLGSFSATADTSGSGKVTWAGAGFSAPFVATPLVTPSGPVTLLNHTISSASSTVAAINGSIITNGTATGSANAGSTGTTLVTASGGNGIATQTYSHFYEGAKGGCLRACPLVASNPTNWFFWGLGIVGAIIGIIAIFVALPLEVAIFGVLCGLLSLFWDLCLLLQ